MRNLLLLLTILGLISSCMDAEKPAASTTTTNPALKAADGTPLTYQFTGSGDTTLLFIHGWNIDQSYWDNQRQYFSPHYKVVSITLPGYAGTAAHPCNCSPELYAKDIALLMDSLSLAPAILIGHSMSGAIIAATAAIRPKETAGIIGIDNFLEYGYQPTKEEKEMNAQVYGQMRRDYKNVVTEYADRYLFSPSTDSTSRNRVLTSFLSEDSTFSVDCLEKMEEYPLDSVLKSLDRPLYLLNSDFHRNDSNSFRKAGIDLHFYNLGPTGHYPMIENAAWFNQLLEQAVHAISAARN